MFSTDNWCLIKSILKCLLFIIFYLKGFFQLLKIYIVEMLASQNSSSIMGESLKVDSTDTCSFPSSLFTLLWAFFWFGGWGGRKYFYHEELSTVNSCTYLPVSYLSYLPSARFLKNGTNNMQAHIFLKRHLVLWINSSLIPHLSPIPTTGPALSLK